MDTPHASWKYAAVLVALALLAALAFPLSVQLAGRQDADGILTAYMSTQQLTWYFWRQDRFLNLLPALAWPLRDVVWNLHFQVFLRAFFAFLAPLGVLYVLRPSARFLLAATVVASALLALLLDGEADFNQFAHHIPVGTSLLLFALSTMAFRSGARRRFWYAAAFAFAVLAYATNIALLLLSFPLLAIVFLTKMLPRREVIAFAALNVLAVALAFAHAHAFGEAQTRFGSGEISWHAIRSGYAVVGAHLHVAAFCVVALAAVVVGFMRPRRETWAALLFALYCIAAIGALSCSQWVQTSRFHIRYYLMFEVGIAACIACVLVGAAEPLLRTRWRLGAFLASSLGVAWFVGLQGASASPFELVGAVWRASTQDWARVAVDRRVQVVAGDFWTAWPTVFEADRLRGIDAVSQLPIFAGTWRSWPLHDRVVQSAGADRTLRVLCLPGIADCAKAVEGAFRVRVDAPALASEDLRDAKGRAMRLLTLRIALPATSSAQADAPPAFVANLIAQFRAAPRANPPARIVRYTWHDQVVYYVPPRCCDVPGALYASDGTRLCEPDGGFVGGGDGKCPDFHDKRRDEKVIWSDAR